MFALDPNVTGQPAQPLRRETAPHDQTQKRHDDANDYDELSKFAHHSKSCANHAEEQA